MAKWVGPELPDDLFHRLSGADLDICAGKVILVCTVDPAGWPHPAMLSYFEVIAKDRRHIRLATYKDSRTTTHMRDQRKVTLSVIDRGVAYYIKGNSQELQREMNGFSHLAKLELEVAQVLSDHADEQLEAAAFVAGGVTYHSSDPAADRLKARAVLKELLE